MDEISGDKIANAVLEQFDTLPANVKPLNRGGGVKEWVPLSGIVAQKNGRLTCLAIATGMKCLPQAKVAQAHGIVLHDWHAEILALRSFNRFLLQECHTLAQSQKCSSEFVRVRTPEERTEDLFQPFALNEDLSLHMYCSEAPCGDASMELTIAAQEDSTPWDTPQATTTEGSKQRAASILPGRSYFSKLGVVRRKPSRPDAPPTLSKSCSDKLSLKQGTSLLSSITSLLIHPSNAYMDSLILPELQYSQSACYRSFGPEGRMRDLKGKDWEGGYAFKPFKIKTTRREFKYSRRQPITTGEKIVSSNISASYIYDSRSNSGVVESLIGGTLQGRKKSDIRGASRVCKRSTWKLALEVATLIAIPRVHTALGLASYGEVKDGELLGLRRRVKREVRDTALRDWIRNMGDEDFDCTGVKS